MKFKLLRTFLYHGVSVTFVCTMAFCTLMSVSSQLKALTGSRASCLVDSDSILTELGVQYLVYVVSPWWLLNLQNFHLLAQESALVVNP